MVKVFTYGGFFEGLRFEEELRELFEAKYVLGCNLTRFAGLSLTSISDAFLLSSVLVEGGT